jgi:hypothetical protein
MSAAKKPTVKKPKAAAKAPAKAPAKPTAAKAEDAKGNKRQQIGKELGIHISSARSRRHLDALNLNSFLNAEIAQRKDKVAEYRYSKSVIAAGTVSDFKEVEKKEGDVAIKVQEAYQRPVTAAEKANFTKIVASTTEAAINALDMDAHALATERKRFSHGAAVAMSIIADEVVQQLSAHPMSYVILPEVAKKIIHPQHLYTAGVEKLSLYPLFATLPAFVEMRDDLAREKSEKDHKKEIDVLLKQAERDFKKKHNVHSTKGKKADVVEAEAVAAEAEEDEPEAEKEDDASDSKISFKFYVGQVCHSVALRNHPEPVDPKAPLDKETGLPVIKTKIRVAATFKDHISELIIQLIQRLSPLIALTASNMKNKTINDIAILRTVEALIIDGHRPVSSFDIVDSQIPDPEWIKAQEVLKKAAKEKGEKYKIKLEDAPKIAGREATYTVTYPNSKFGELEAVVKAKLAKYDELKAAGKVDKKEQDE